MDYETIRASDAFGECHTEPDHVAAYNALEVEFSLADALIRVRAELGMTQDGLLPVSWTAS